MSTVVVAVTDTAPNDPEHEAKGVSGVVELDSSFRCSGVSLATDCAKGLHVVTLQEKGSGVSTIVFHP